MGNSVEITGPYGIDTIKLSVPLDTEGFAHDFGRHRIADGAIRVSYHLPDRGPAALVELEVSRFWSSDGVPCPTAAVAPVLDAVFALEEMRTLVEPRVLLSDARVQRLDVARDFGVDDPPWWIARLKNQLRWYGRKRLCVEANRTNAVPWLLVGGKNDKVRIYDRSTKLPKGKFRGLRWELQATAKGWLPRAGIYTLADVTPAKVDALALQRWEWSRMGVQILSTRLLLDRIDALDITDRDKRDLYALAVASWHGRKLTLSRAAEKRLWDLARQVGLPREDPIGQEARRSSRTRYVTRLDFHSGKTEGRTLIQRRTSPAGEHRGN